MRDGMSVMRCRASVSAKDGVIVVGMHFASAWRRAETCTFRTRVARPARRQLFFCTATCRPLCSLDGAVCLVPIEKGTITEALAYIKNCDPQVVDAEDHTDSFLWAFVTEACDCLYLVSCSLWPLEGR